MRLINKSIVLCQVYKKNSLNAVQHGENRERFISKNASSNFNVIFVSLAFQNSATERRIKRFNSINPSSKNSGQKNWSLTKSAQHRVRNY